jgi:hypothetical protein
MRLQRSICVMSLTSIPFCRVSQEWKDWIEAFNPMLAEVDDQIPELPPKDVIHRIYRDVSIFLPRLLIRPSDALGILMKRTTDTV